MVSMTFQPAPPPKHAVAGQQKVQSSKEKVVPAPQSAQQPVQPHVPKSAVVQAPPPAAVPERSSEPRVIIPPSFSCNSGPAFCVPYDHPMLHAAPSPVSVADDIGLAKLGGIMPSAHFVCKDAAERKKAFENLKRCHPTLAEHAYFCYYFSDFRAVSTQLRRGLERDIVTRIEHRLRGVVLEALERERMQRPCWRHKIYSHRAGDVLVWFGCAQCPSYEAKALGHDFV